MTEIGTHAFQNCSGMTSISIGSGVKSLGGETFRGCRGLRAILCYAEIPPECGGLDFIGIDARVCTLYVLQNSIEAYREAEWWGRFADIKSIGDGETSIASPTKNILSHTIYDLSGRKIANNQQPKAKGLYIVDGKKVAVK